MAAAAPTGSVDIGRHRLEVGSAAGTLIAASRAPPDTRPDTARLARALDEGPWTPGRVAERQVDTAAEVTTRTEQTVGLFRDLAAGRIEPRNASAHVDLMLELLRRLDRQGRWAEALRLARALNGLLALLSRWADLVRSLKVARAAADRLGDLFEVAWSEHELGTLHLAAGDHAGADRRLEQAERIRREIDDRAGLAATRQNLQILCRELRDELHEGRARLGRGRRRLALALAGLLLLLIGGVAGAIVDRENPEDEAALEQNEPQPGTEPPPATVTTPATTPTPTPTVEISVSTTGDGTVTSVPEGIACGDDCVGSYPAGEEVVLTADGDLIEWGDGCSGSEPTCTLAPQASISVTASFQSSVE